MKRGHRRIARLHERCQAQTSFRCSEEREKGKPPSTSAEYVTTATRMSGMHDPACYSLCNNGAKEGTRTLKAKLESTWASPGLDSYRLPAFSSTVTLEVGCTLSIAATLKPEEESTTVAKPRFEERTRRVALSICLSLCQKVSRNEGFSLVNNSSRNFTVLTLKKILLHDTQSGFELSF
jgi:hypothetical protein